jgi:hypothetical protein
VREIAVTIGSQAAWGLERGVAMAMAMSTAQVAVIAVLAAVSADARSDR